MPSGNKSYYTDTSEGLRPMNGMSEVHPKQITPEEGKPTQDMATSKGKDSFCGGGTHIKDVMPGSELGA
jgi:hypothetical protein